MLRKRIIRIFTYMKMNMTIILAPRVFEEQKYGYKFCTRMARLA